MKLPIFFLKKIYLNNSTDKDLKLNLRSLLHFIEKKRLTLKLEFNSIKLLRGTVAVSILIGISSKYTSS